MEEYIIPEGFFYCRGDTWVTRTAEGRIRAGITDYAQKRLKKIEYLSLPSENDVIKQEESFGEIESSKSLSELIAPVTACVQECNADVADTPALINNDPYGKGWLLELTCGNYEEQTAYLMDAAAYRAYRNL